MFGKISITWLLIAVIVIAIGLFWFSSRDSYAPGSEEEVNFRIETTKDNNVVPASASSVKHTADEQPAETNNVVPSVITQPSEEEPDGYVASEQRTSNVMVFEPNENATVSSPFTVRGEARVDNNKVYIRIVNLAGTTLIQESANVHSVEVGQFGEFKISLNYQFTTTKEGVVEVYSKDASGKEQNIVKVPVIFN